MTNLEINKRIAKLKGWEFIKEKKWPDGSISKNYWKDPEIGRRPLLNWSEDISDAWELFEELPFNTKALFYHDVYCTWEVRMHSRRVVFEETEQYAMEETASIAICLAWIEWKENR